MAQLTTLSRYIKVRHLSSQRDLSDPLTKEDLIIPQVSSLFTRMLSPRPLLQHYTFYDFIVNKARGKSGPLFNFDVHDDVRLLADATVEKDEVSSPFFHPAVPYFSMGVDYFFPFLMSSHVTTSQSHGIELWPPPPLVPRRKGGGEELVPAQQAYLPSITLGGFRPREELRKIHDRVASTILSMRVFSPSYSEQSISCLQEHYYFKHTDRNKTTPSQNSKSTVVSSSIASASLPRASSKSISSKPPCLVTQGGGLNRYMYPSSQVEYLENTLSASAGSSGSVPLRSAKKNSGNSAPDLEFF